ncbi:hypothetical protein SAMN05661091_3265 [Paenibacillus uliginis N3/975]|uniref:Uncharacterized protein n=1 Tax=Paenibacillus uliginis N3/975 TaxID=1313296 RepID=A0A1X7HG12_9BACL|nr:hypothetical protein [Paenibacillus uliginis]SMF86057.1 hypothetical protein SAMN05661091_3265 [Paenibacillus uliginis N3/975]
MRKVEWMLAVALMAVGLMCLMVSATSDPEGSLLNLGPMLVRICLLIGLVLIVVGSIYVLIKWMRKR